MQEEVFEIRDLIRIFRPMGAPFPNVRPGEVVEILACNSNSQEMMIPLTVVVVYLNGDYIGEIVWALA